VFIGDRRAAAERNRTVAEVQDVISDEAIVSPEVNVTSNRDKFAALQVNADAIENAFYDAYGPRWVSTIYAAINEYKVLRVTRSLCKEDGLYSSPEEFEVQRWLRNNRRRGRSPRRKTS